MVFEMRFLFTENKVYTINQLTGKKSSMELSPEKIEQAKRYLAKENKTFIQMELPNFTNEEREFFLTGIAPGDFNELIGE